MMAVDTRGVTVFTEGAKTLSYGETATQSGQIDGWSEDLLTSNSIFQEQLASSLSFGPWQCLWAGIPKHLVINYTSDNDLCCLIFTWWSQHFLRKQ